MNMKMKKDQIVYARNEKVFKNQIIFHKREKLIILYRIAPYANCLMCMSLETGIRGLMAEEDLFLRTNFKKYARTKDGEIIEILEKGFCEDFIEMWKIRKNKQIEILLSSECYDCEKNIVKEADTIEDLFMVGDWIKNLDNCIFMIDTEEHRQELIKYAKEEALYVVNTLYIEKNGDLIKTAEKIDDEWEVI